MTDESSCREKELEFTIKLDTVPGKRSPEERYGKSGSREGLVIFQSFINEHNL